MGIEYFSKPLYNLGTEKKLTYYNTLLTFCQERNFAMEPEPLALKELITIALEECTDESTLDLVYKLLTYNN